MQIGDRVRFKTMSGHWVVGTIRDFKQGEYRVDDGDPMNNDLLTNGFHHSAWLNVHALRKVPNQETLFPFGAV